MVKNKLSDFKPGQVWTHHVNWNEDWEKEVFLILYVENEFIHYVGQNGTLTSSWVNSWFIDSLKVIIDV